ncbi:MAG: hypothetical protein LBU32_08865 [Clostridiales bacterium]|jgi:hypothetical protein|nr:hypothetical protein [Clostridiales bacterium]
MNENTSQAAPKTFGAVDGSALMAQECEPLRFAVEKMPPCGFSFSRGAAKSESRGCPFTSA